MKIHGLQKMTLLDYPGHVACTVFLGGCDLRCPFCHNYELIDGSAEPIMDEQELLDFLKKRQGLLDGVAITGGEPCLRPDLIDLIKEIRALGYPVKLDTNGLHPDVLRTLVEERLVDYVAMDIKNSPEHYAATSGVEAVDLGRIRESISILMEGPVDYEFRTTVIDQLHSAQDMEGIGALIQGARRFFLQAFTDRDSVPFAGFSAPSADKMRIYADIVGKYVQEITIRGVDL